MSSLSLEHPYFHEQVLTCIGNKRQHLPWLASHFSRISSEFGRPLYVLDGCSGSGVVSRLLRLFSSHLVWCDIEPYAAMVAKCYLTNPSEVNMDQLDYLRGCAMTVPTSPGFIAEMYAPKNDKRIKEGERVFFTRDNARFLDRVARFASVQDDSVKPFLLGPLIYLASKHANTSGVFKGFHKNKETGIGQFGGTKSDALKRILHPMDLPLPVLYETDCEVYGFEGNILEALTYYPGLDLAYFDPPYNQHPYGSNYFMLNLLCNYQKPNKVSQVSGIPEDWNRSDFYRRREAKKALEFMVETCSAQVILISYNSTSFLSLEDWTEIAENQGRSIQVYTKVSTKFRGARRTENQQSNRLQEWLLELR